METTLTAWRRKIQQIEVKAAGKVDDIFRVQLFSLADMRALDMELIKAIQPEIKAAMAEGVKFGDFIRKYSRKIGSKPGNTDEGNGD